MSALQQGPMQPHLNPVRLPSGPQLSAPPGIINAGLRPGVANFPIGPDQQQMNFGVPGVVPISRPHATIGPPGVGPVKDTHQGPMSQESGSEEGEIVHEDPGPPGAKDVDLRKPQDSKRGNQFYSQFYKNQNLCQ